MVTRRLGGGLASKASCTGSAVETATGKDHLTFDLWHGPGNSRNSEGAFVTLRDGRILFAYTRYVAGGGHDADPADIAGICSSDGGCTWAKDAVILVPNEGGCNVMSVSLLRLADGRIAMFYLRKNGSDDCCPFVRFSNDEAATWSDPVQVMSYLGYFVLNNDRVVQLRSGRILVPIGHHRHVVWPSRKGEIGIDSRAQFIVAYSDDGGITWQEGPERWSLPSGRDCLQEPGVIELADGRVWAWLRTDTGRQWQSFSRDNGLSWTLPTPSRFRSPISPLSMKRIPSTGHLLAIWNDAGLAERLWGEAKKLPPGGWLRDASWGRTPLVAAVSRDDGRTWSRPRILEREPDHGYCYVAIHFTDDAALLAYCCGGGASGHVLQDLRIRRVPVKWFYGRES